MSFPEDTDPAAVARELVEAGVNLRRLTPLRRSLEDVYLEVTGDSQEEEENS